MAKVNVHLPISVVNSTYQNDINFENGNIAISQLFGLTLETANLIELIISYDSETVSIAKVDKFSRDLEISLPQNICKIAVFVKSQKILNLEDISKEVIMCNVKYLILNDNCLESHHISVFSINGNDFKKVDSEINILNSGVDALEKFGYKICKYTLCVQRKVDVEIFETGLRVPDQIMAGEIHKIIKSIDRFAFTIDEEVDTFTTDVNFCKILKNEESNMADEASILSLLVQLAVVFVSGIDKIALENMVSKKFESFFEYLSGKVETRDYDYLTLAISRVEHIKSEFDEAFDILATKDNFEGKRDKPKGKGKGKRGKGNSKSIQNRPNKQACITAGDSDLSIMLAKNIPYTPVTKTGTISLDIELDPNDSSMAVRPSSTDDSAKSPALVPQNVTMGVQKISLLFKLESLQSICESIKSIPITIQFYRLISQLTLSQLGYSCYFKYPFLIKPYDPRVLLDESVIISPHVKMDRPCWVSSKHSTVARVSGNYGYYHYCMDKIDDSGWGCCYRSLQMVWSWYLLQNYTASRVPNHWEMQSILNENDSMGKVIKVGSNTWIGTVESSYIINWKLNMLCKIYYLEDSSYLADYSSVMMEHFLLQKTPIIIAVGVYAYVIVGICVDLDNEPAYLIADPHYAGLDNFKSVVAKGVGWKRKDFLTKAAESGFINLLLPQTTPYTQ